MLMLPVRVASVVDAECSSSEGVSGSALMESWRWSCWTRV